MGIPCLIFGESGTGKSASLRNFAPDEVAVINVCGKPLPFKSKLKTLKTDDYMKISPALMSPTGVKSYVIDDAQYLMADEFMRRVNERGYDKFTEIAYHFWHLVQEVVVQMLPDDKIVYFLMHTDTSDDGRVRAKTIGKMLNEKITLEGLFTIVLRTQVSDGVYTFRTVNSGSDTVKTPMGMFESAEIDNDLKMVDDTIRAYYGINSKKGGESGDVKS